MNYLTKTEMRTYKSALTRAKNSGDPQRVIDVVDRTFAEWDAGGFAYPDNWHLWERAANDALVQRRMEQW